MENKSYQLRYLPIFETDLLSTVNYITNVLKNEDAAHRLVDDIESAILKRLENPLAFEPYRSAKRREYPYYRIYVRNYVVYYVVIGNVMEVRRCRTDFADIQNKKECGGNRQWQNHYLRNWAANTKGKGII